jgi:triosephosphate isomerase
MRSVCVAGNWKMHNTVGETKQLLEELKQGLNAIDGVISILCPPFTALAVAAELIKDSK